MTQAVDEFVKRVNGSFDWVQDAEWFLGSKSLLCQACQEICRDSGADRLLAALDRIRQYDVSQLHKAAINGLDTDDGLRAQLFAQVQPVFSGLRAAVELFLLAEQGLTALATAYDQAWPPTRVFRRAADTGNQEFDGALGSWPAGGSFGYWIARHLFAKLKPKDGRLQPSREGTARTPVLFVDVDGRVGKIGKLTVELFAGAGPLIADPFSLGLTLLSRGKEGFHEALQRAWWRSGLSGQDLHARWRIEPYQSTDRDPSAVPILDGRSVEAAVCCALWAAYGGIPTRDDGRQTQVELDDYAVVTAMFAGATADDYESATSPSGKLTDAKLEDVGGLSAKLKSVKASSIDLVVVHKKQKIDKTDQDETAGLHIEPVATIGEAFDALWALERCRRAYQQAQVKPFREKFYFAPKEEPEARMAEAQEHRAE